MYTVCTWWDALTWFHSLSLGDNRCLLLLNVAGKAPDSALVTPPLLLCPSLSKTLSAVCEGDKNRPGGRHTTISLPSTRRGQTVIEGDTTPSRVEAAGSWFGALVKGVVAIAVAAALVCLVAKLTTSRSSICVSGTSPWTSASGVPGSLGYHALCSQTVWTRP